MPSVHVEIMGGIDDASPRSKPGQGRTGHDGDAWFGLKGMCDVTHKLQRQDEITQSSGMKYEDTHDIAAVFFVS